MSITLYHRTDMSDARAIIKNGFEDREWEFGLHDARTGKEVSVSGVWLMDRPVSPEDGLDGDTVLEVILDVDYEELAPFELEGMLWDGRFWVAPAEWVNDRSTVRFKSIDPNTSGFFDATNGQPDPLGPGF